MIGKDRLSSLPAMRSPPFVLPRPSAMNTMTLARRKRNSKRRNTIVVSWIHAITIVVIVAQMQVIIPDSFLSSSSLPFHFSFCIVIAAAAAAASGTGANKETSDGACHVDGNPNGDHSDYNVDKSNNKVVWDVTSDQTIYRCNIQRYTWSEFKSKFNPRSASPSNDGIGGRDVVESDMHDLHHLLPLLYPHPIVIVNDEDNDNVFNNHNKEFRKMVDRHNIVEFFPPDFNVTLSSSNSFSEHRRTIPLQTYIEEIITNSSSSTTTRRGSTVSPDTRSNETWYLFGETYSDEWKRLLRHYELPPCEACIRDNTYYDDYHEHNDEKSQKTTSSSSYGSAALSFGIGGKGSGVQWHVHGPGWSESLVGRKHWVMYESNKKPIFDPDQTSYHWMYYEYPKLLMVPSSNLTSRHHHHRKPQKKQKEKQNRKQRKATTLMMTEKKTDQDGDTHKNLDDDDDDDGPPLPSPPWECTLNAGDLIYFPDMWWHATINLDEYTAFISTFTQDHLLLQQQEAMNGT